jgi:3-oxoadipate enol-lactonase
MPVIQSNGCPIHFEVLGRESSPVLMLSNSLGTTLHMWDAQVKPFTEHFRLVRYDRRGHGKSGCPKGPYTMEQLGRDALAVMDALDVEKANWCGLSMGGMVGMWLGANAPDRFEKIILSNTSAYYADKGPWNTRIENVRKGGLAAIADMVMKVWFTEDFRDREPTKVDAMKDMLLQTPVEG